MKKILAIFVLMSALAVLGSCSSSDDDPVTPQTTHNDLDTSKLSDLLGAWTITDEWEDLRNDFKSCPKERLTFNADGSVLWEHSVYNIPGKYTFESGTFTCDFGTFGVRYYTFSHYNEYCMKVTMKYDHITCIYLAAYDY